MTKPRSGSTRRKPSRKEGFDLDEILGTLGGFGKFQFLNFLQIAVIISIAGATEISYVFTTAEVKHRCVISECESNNSAYNQSWLNHAIPSQGGAHRQCERYTVTSVGNTCGDTKFNETISKCDKFIYETDEWTIAREDWGIHCEDDRWMLTLVGSINNAGLVVGSLYVGFLCDRFGRKMVILCTSLLVLAMGTLKSFSTSYPMFLACEFLETSLEGGLFTLPFMLALEIVSHSKRVFAGGIVSCAYPVGEMLVAIVQWLTMDWRTTLKIVRLPFVLIIIFFWTLPESTRWLVAQRRNQDAVNVLRTIAKINGTKLDDVVVEQILNADGNVAGAEPVDKKAEYIAVAKSHRLRLRFLAIIFVWIANTFIFFGMNLTSVSINDDKFVNSILTVIIEMPSYLSCAYFMNTIGRRYTQSISLLLCCFACLCSAYVPADWTWAQLLLFLIGKYGIAVSFIGCDMFTTELFPTGVRGSAISTGHMIGRIAAILAPQTPLLSDVYKPLPLILFSIVAALGAGFAFSLPETLGTKLPDTVKEAEDLGREENTIKV